MNFQIAGLDAARFTHLFELAPTELQSRRAVRVIASGTGFPCRVGLRDAEVGEELILLNFTHQEAASPYQSSHAIYVARNSISAKILPNQVPEMVASRLISVRAFNQDGFMTDAEVCEGSEAASLFGSMLDEDDVRYLHVHTARRGCYLARVERG